MSVCVCVCVSVPFAVHLLLLFDILLFILSDVGHADLEAEIREHTILHLMGEAERRRERREGEGKSP